MYTKPRNMRTASRKITRGFDGFSEQAVSQPALHSRNTCPKRKLMRNTSQKKAALACKPFYFGIRIYEFRIVY